MRLCARAAGIAALVIATLLTAGSSAATPGAIAVSTDRRLIQTELGASFGFRTTITNRGAKDTDALIAHLNILSLRAGAYVDPEDWSSQRTVYLGAVPTGASRTVSWRLKAVDDGELAAYATVVSQGDPAAEPPVAGAAVRVSVRKRTTINPDGILPLAIGVPALLAVAAGAVRLARRR